jgi:hypothetical protein
MSARLPSSPAVTPGHMPASSDSVGVRCQKPSPSSTRPPGLTRRRSSARAASTCPGGSTSVIAWLAPVNSTRSAGPRLVLMPDSWTNVTRSPSPRAWALAWPRARSPSSVSRPSPVAWGAAARMRSISSPQPQPMSSTEPGWFAVSRATIRAARASDSGPWKVSLVSVGGRSASTAGASVIWAQASPGPAAAPNGFFRPGSCVTRTAGGAGLPCVTVSRMRSKRCWSSASWTLR